MSYNSGINAIYFICGIVSFIFFSANTATAVEKPIIFEADSVIVDQADGSMLATGNVILEQSGNRLTADEVIYYKNTGHAVARGNVTHVDADNTISRANFMEIDTEFTHIISETLISQFSSGDWMAADQVDRRAGDRSIFKKSRFTPCNCDFVNGERPLWEIQATESLHNEKTQTITHFNLRMYVMNVPLLYLPYLSHPDWTVRRRSGFLTPSFLISSDLGFTPSIPYFHVIDYDSDAEFNVYKYQHRGAAVKTQYRKLWEHSKFKALLYSANVETYKHSRELVGAVDASFQSNIGKGWEVSSRLVRSSQDTFLRRYKFNTETTLKSNVIATRIEKDRYYYVEASDRQSLTTANDNTNEPTILPHIFYEKVQSGWRPQQHFRTEISALQLDNDEDNDYARWSGLIEVTEDLPLQKGFANYNANIIASHYEVHDQPSSATTNLGAISQANPSISLGWRMPLGVNGFGKTAIIEPKSQLTFVGGSDRTNDMPNRDSAEYRIDEANLFLTHRYQGKDYILPGTRADLGIAVTANDSYQSDINGFVGISRRISGKPSAGLNINQDDTYSDYVASLAMSPANLFDVRWSGRLSSHDFTLNESTTVASTSFGTGHLNFTHSQLNEAYFSSSEDDREELSASYSQTIGEHWSMAASQIWDLSYGTKVREKSTAALIWSGGPQDCLKLTVNYEKNSRADRDIGSVEQVNFIVSFKQLGAEVEDTLAGLRSSD